MATTRYSKQRESIKEYLSTHFTHPTAERIYLDLRKEFPTISQGTVYRNLNLLAEQGEILRISSGNGPDRFDGNIHPHCHFLCKECGKVLDIDVDPKPELDALANSNFGGMVDSHVTLFLGQCPNCYH